MARAALAMPGLAMLLLALAGCGSLREGRLDPGLFPAPSAADAAAAPAPGRVALTMAPSVRDRVFSGERLRAPMPSVLSVPAGRLVEAALLRALQGSFAGGVLPSSQLPTTAAGVAATVAVTDLQFSYDETLRYFIPIPVPNLLFISEYDVTLRLIFDVQVLDGTGRPLWARRYDSGRVLWQRPADGRELSPDGVLRLAHEAAWQQAWQLVRELRAWLDADRTRERRL